MKNLVRASEILKEGADEIAQPEQVSKAGVLVAITIDVVPDDDPDVSYLNQKEFKKRKKEYAQGYSNFVGVIAKGLVENADGKEIEYQSMGLWGIESDSDIEHFEAIFNEELDDLEKQLTQANVDISGIDILAKNAKYWAKKKI